MSNKQILVMSRYFAVPSTAKSQQGPCCKMPKRSCGPQHVAPESTRRRRQLLAKLAVALNSLVFVLGTTALGAESIEVKLEGDVIYYKGALNSAGLKRLQAAYGQAEAKPAWLGVSSDGGEVNAAMDFGDWIFANKLSIRILDRCLSSCANYLFTAATVKHIEAGAIVAWHGSALQSSDASRSEIKAVIDTQVLPAMKPQARPALRTKLLADTLAYLDIARDRQRQFFAKIDVDETVTTVGQGRDGISDFWFLSVSDMAQFGINFVVAPDHYATTDTSRFGRNRVRLLTLGRD